MQEIVVQFSVARHSDKNGICTSSSNMQFWRPDVSTTSCRYNHLKHTIWFFQIPMQCLFHC